MPSSWRYSEIIPIYKGEGSVLEYGNYRGTKLMSHTMKLWERIIENSGIGEYPVRIPKRNVHDRTNICTENITRKVQRKKERYTYGIC